MSRSPLAGIRVLDLSRLLPGPFLTLVLSDLGADVVKVEELKLGDYLREVPPTRQGWSGRFVALNRNKRSLALNLKIPVGRDAFLHMAEKADVVVESFRPGILDKLGVGWATLSQRNPRLILCSISGYGQTGPYAQRAGHDLNYIALAGILALTGSLDGPPRMPGVQIADLAGGALWAAIGILAALLERGTTGRGQHLDIAMTEGAMALLMAELGNRAVSDHVPRRGNEALNGGWACYNIYATQDGKYLAVAALEPKFWLAFNTAIGRPADISELALPRADQDRIRAEIQAVLLQKTQAEWMSLFAHHDVCVEPVLELDELDQHPQHQARGVFAMLEHPELGRIPQLRLPVGNTESLQPPPHLGQHSIEVLQEYGLSEAEIAELKAAGVFGV